MAEKKAGDVLIGIIFGLFFLGALGTIILGFDGIVGNNFVSSGITNVYNKTQPGYEDTEVNLYQDTFNTSVFSIPSDSDVDPRGTSQVIEVTRSSPSTIRNFINSVGSYIPLHWSIIALFSSIAITLTFILLLRFFRPGGA